MKLITLTVAFLFLQFSLFSQLTTDNYKPLVCKGPIPNEFIIKTDARYPSILNLKSVELHNELIVRDLLHSGHILFGDEISEYVKNVASELLKDDAQLGDKLSFYVFKSAEVLSFSTESGLIFISTGMISQLTKENQLAFAIAHEIGHFALRHKNYPYIGGLIFDVSDVGLYESKKSFQTFFIRDQDENELADDYAVKMLSRSKYDVKSAQVFFDVLTFSYLPFEEKVFDTAFFNYDSSFVVPHLNLPELTEVNPTELGKLSRANTLKTIDARRRNFVSQIDLKTNNSSKGVSNLKEFERIRDLARFELIRINLIDRQYFNAIYHSFVMLQKYPDNDYLNRSIVKALYAIATYKTNSALKWLDMNENQGESSYLNLLFDNLTTDQVSVLAVVNIKKYLDKHPDDGYIISLQESLIRNIKKHTQLKYSSFYEKVKTNDSKDDEAQKEVDENALTSKYDRIAQSRKEQINGESRSNFHLYVSDLFDPDSLISNSFKNESESIYAHGREIDPTVLTIDPILKYENRQYGMNLFKSENDDRKLNYILSKTTEIGKVNIKPISRRSITTTSIDEFNSLSELKMWFSEAIPHLGLEDFISLESDYYYNFAEEKNIKFACYGFSEYKAAGDDVCKYRLALFELQTGRIRCSKYQASISQLNTGSYLRFFKEIMRCLN